MRTSNRSDQIPERSRIERLNIISTVNLLGFSMLCGLPAQTDSLLLDRHRCLSNLVPLNDIVQRLLGWIDYYGNLTVMRERLIHFITSKVSGSKIKRSTLFYLRIACVLHDHSFFSWVLDKNPFFSNDVWLGMSSLDTRLGLDLWTSAFERRLNLFGSVLRGLRNLPELVPPRDQGTTAADGRERVRCAWNSWLSDRAAESQAVYEHIKPSLLALQSIAVAGDVIPYYSCIYGHPTPSNASHYLRHALIMAKKEIARHITVNECEPFGFQINDYDSFPWEYRMDEDTDETLLNLITTSELFEVNEDLASDQ